MTETEFNPSYTAPRTDLLNLVPTSANRILDVGCSVGTLGQQIKNSLGAEVVGIETHEEMARLARTRIDKVIIGDVEEIDLAEHFPSNYFDCIIFGDVLEHLRDPWKVLEHLTRYLVSDGIMIASIPNIRHYMTILQLACGYWPYRERGIHDKTHLRFFTLRSIQEMFQTAQLNVVSVKRKYRIVERPHRYNKYSRHFSFWPLRDFVTFQYLIVAMKDRQKN